MKDSAQRVVKSGVRGGVKTLKQLVRGPLGLLVLSLPAVLLGLKLTSLAITGVVILAAASFLPLGAVALLLPAVSEPRPPSTAMALPPTPRPFLHTQVAFLVTGVLLPLIPLALFSIVPLLLVVGVPLMLGMWAFSEPVVTPRDVEMQRQEEALEELFAALTGQRPPQQRRRESADGAIDVR
jgi:hypothetical protein